jgi:type I restriction enzyme S subunit
MTLRTLLDRFELLMDTPESVPKLRRFILQLAVRGRLSDRRASDEPAETLVEQMEAEKERLDAAGEYKYQKTMPPIEEDDIPFSFSVPEGWTWVRLGNLGKVYGGGTPKKSNSAYWGGNIPWVSPKDMNGAVIQSTEDQITQKGLEESSAKLVPPGSLLIVGRSGILERKLPVGVTAVECTANQDLKVLTPFVSGMARYIRLILKGFEPYILDELVKTGTTVRSLKYTEFQLQPYPLPPLEEQQRIVETVDGLMDECDALEEQQERERTLQVQVGTAATEALHSAEDAEALRPAWERVREHFDTVTATSEGVDALRKTILQLAVQGRLTERDPDDTPAGKLLKTLGNGVADEIDQSRLPSLPRNWQWTKLKDLLSNLRNGYSKAPRADSGTPVLRISAVRPLSVDLNDVRFLQTRPDDFEKYLAHPGDLLFIRYNGNEGLVGACAVMPSSVEAIGHPDKLIRGEIQRPDLTLPSYVAVAVNCGKSRHHIDDKSKTTAGNYGISQTDLRSTPIPVPPVEEQARIVDVVDQLLPLCDNLNMLLFETDEHGEQLLEAALRDTSVDRPDAVPAGATA